MSKALKRPQIVQRGSSDTPPPPEPSIPRNGRPLLSRNKSEGQVDGLLSLGGSRRDLNYHTLKVCKYCTRKPLRCTARDLQLAAAVANFDLADHGLFELIHSIRNEKLYQEGPSVALSQADAIVARSQDKVLDFETQRQANIERYAPQDLGLYKENLDAMGKFEWDELKIGALLGTGGFSNVSEIWGFALSENSTMTYTSKEKVARKFLAKHAKRSPDDLTTSSHHSSFQTEFETVRYRYALKHLRPKLSSIYDERTFRCAAVDLISEVHFLLSLQHPNIIKIRGFAAAGPQGYRQGNHNGYFLVLDLLPETMEHRLVAWRKKVKKYLSVKRSLVSKVLLKRNRETASRKLDQLLDERYLVAYEICGAMEYLHQRRMVNRDLKIANIGFDIRGDVKLFDFGLSRWLPTSLLSPDKATPKAILEEKFHMSSVGTKLYMAPEVQLKKPYNTKADVFSFGIVLWEILCLSDPLWNRPTKDKALIQERAQEAYDNIPLCPCWPLAIQKTLKQCISPTANDRPTFAELRQMFRDELLVVEDEDGRVRPSMATSSPGSELEEDDHMKYASDDDIVRRASSHRQGMGNLRESHTGSEDDCGGEDEDSVGALKVVRHNNPVVRRRSTHILDFKNLSWLSSGSLAFSAAGGSSNSSIRFSSKEFRVKDDKDATEDAEIGVMDS
jgi:serine/threonine protein kinase